MTTLHYVPHAILSLVARYTSRGERCVVLAATPAEQADWAKQMRATAGLDGSTVFRCCNATEAALHDSGFTPAGWDMIDTSHD